VIAKLTYLREIWQEYSISQTNSNHWKFNSSTLYKTMQNGHFKR